MRFPIKTAGLTTAGSWSVLFMFCTLLSAVTHAGVTSIEVRERQTLSEPGVPYTYESLTGVVHFTLGLPDIEHTVAWGISQSGRLLRLFLYDGFNADLEGRIVFDGVVPVIAGGGFGMFNNRFAMPTRTNGHHSNFLYPNDLFPFTYGDSTDPYTGRTDGILSKARETGTVPKVMHIQTSNEYWVRAGSLAHTDPLGAADAVVPEEVRFYTIGGSQHGSGDGMVREATRGQLPANPNMWSPISESLLAAMFD